MTTTKGHKHCPTIYSAWTPLPNRKPKGRTDEANFQLSRLSRLAYNYKSRSSSRTLEGRRRVLCEYEIAVGNWKEKGAKKERDAVQSKRKIWNRCPQMVGSLVQCVCVRVMVIRWAAMQKPLTCSSGTICRRRCSFIFLLPLANRIFRNDNHFSSFFCSHQNPFTDFFLMQFQFCCTLTYWLTAAFLSNVKSGRF